MITYHSTPSGGRFEVSGKTGKSCDAVLDLYLGGMKADKEATIILKKWVREADENAERCEKAWDKFHEETHGVYMNGI